MGASRSWSHERDWLGAPGDVAAARWFIADRLHGHGLSNVVDDAQLVVSELATNAMVHAATSFKVSLHAFEQTLLLEVEDGSQVGPSLVATRVLDTNGRGMAIVDLLSRDWGVDTHGAGGKSVWAEFSLL